MSLYNAINNQATTTNGSASHKSTLNSNLDLFFQSGASRGKDITNLFAAALSEDKNLAVRCLQWLRDVRGGAGERQQFRTLAKYLVDSQETDAVLHLIDKIPELGRFDDLLVFYGTKYQGVAFKRIELALMQENGLCAKWMPRQGEVAKALRKSMGITTPKAWRKMLVRLSNTVEQQMCANDWENIEYGKVPSVAASRYSRAFGKHDPEGYEAYKERLSTGEDKVNAGAVYPYDVVKNVSYGDSKLADEQWKALPNFMEDNDENILCMVDTSGSMSWPAGGANSNSVTSCKDVAISLGLYISERSEGIFKDQFLSFSANPKLHKVEGESLTHRYHSMDTNDWDMNTNLEKAFSVILDAAVKNKVPESEMPDKLLILSDMQFDKATNGNGYRSFGRREDFESPNPRMFDNIREQYNQAGYEMPQVVFWNINSSPDNVPVTMNDVGVALVSGFSPSILTNLLGGELDPVKIMLKTLLNERYDWSGS